MALPGINLDDLDYQQLLGILKSHIRAEDWSDHNPSDPGIALLELLSWLGEMDLYRLNRVPDSHRAKFLKLLLDPPVPVISRVTFERTSGTATELPPGLRVATDFKKGQRFVFETFTRATLSSPLAGEPPAATLVARAIRELTDVVLGVTSDAPNQTFKVPEAPVLIDFASIVPSNDPLNPVYDCNPIVVVGSERWELKQFLRTPASQGSPLPKHFMFDEFENCIRFGDDVFGAIPPPNQKVTLVRCQVLEGPAALVAETQLKHFLNPGKVTGATLEVSSNTDAEGGENFPSADETPTSNERIRRGLEQFRNPTRLITAADFERVATEDFNQFQRNFNFAQDPAADQDRDTVQRAVAVMNRKPPLLGSIPSAGHVTLMVLPAYDADDFESASPASKANLVKPSDGLTRRLLAYLEPRRLITTRLHVVGPELKSVAAQIVVVIENQRNTAEMQTTVEQMLRSFLSLTTGHDDGKGWPLGRAVRRSQLFRVLEDIPGVDHVRTLALSPANAQGDVELDPRQLPIWDPLNVLVTRT